MILIMDVLKIFSKLSKYFLILTYFKLLLKLNVLLKIWLLLNIKSSRNSYISDFVFVYPGAFLGIRKTMNK